MEKEIWKDVPQYEGRYQVSNLGRVRSLDRILTYSDGRVARLRGKLMKTQLNCGYVKVGLSIDGVLKSKRVHQLVAMAFLGHVKCGQKLVVDHIDNNPLNNNLNNLQVITQRENLSKDKKGSSKYVGVSWYKATKRWLSRIRGVDGKQISLGYFENEIDAHNAYQNYLKNNL